MYAMMLRKMSAALTCCALLLGFGVDAGGRGAQATATLVHATLQQKTQSRLRRKSRRATVKKMSDKTEKTARLATGMWGGDHIRLSVRADGAAVEFDCAHGTIDEALNVSTDGRLDVRGTFTREGPGPIRVNAKPSARPARYEGSLSGTQLTLKITLTDTAQDAGTFTLTQGSAGRVWKCR
jgi:hypothetical protein